MNKTGDDVPAISVCLVGENLGECGLSVFALVNDEV